MKPKRQFMLIGTVEEVRARAHTRVRLSSRALNRRRLCVLQDIPQVPDVIPDVLNDLDDDFWPTSDDLVNDSDTQEKLQRRLHDVRCVDGRWSRLLWRDLTFVGV